MPSIFISYRREESADFCDLITDHLVRKFGNQAVFRDVDSILAGSNFAKALQYGLGETKVVLVIIGPQWLQLNDGYGHRRIDMPQDYVHYEIATALRAGKQIIPVLVNGATLPSADELPSDIAGLAYCTPYTVRNDPYFADDMKAAVAAFQSTIGWQPTSVSLLIIGVLALIAIVVGLLTPGKDDLLIGTFTTRLPELAGIFAIVRSARTQRWGWFAIVLSLEGLAIISSVGLIFGSAISQYVLTIAVNVLAFVLVAFGLIGPRRPFVPSKYGQRPAVSHVPIMVTWGISLLSFVELFIAATEPHGSESTLALFAFYSWIALSILGDVMAVIRSAQTNRWGLGAPLGIVGFLSLGLIALSYIPALVSEQAASSVLFYLLTINLILLGVFGWRGPYAIPTPKPLLDTSAA